MLPEKIADRISQTCHLEKDKPIVVGVSGGADSLCLLEVLITLGYPVIVAHFNHQLRAEAAEDARYVESIAQAAHVPLLMGTGDVAGFASTEGRSLEDAARELRYRFLFEQARLHEAQAVVVGHTADDQVETVLMHLIRGSGLQGLTGMPSISWSHAWDRQIPLVRPLLTTWHAETLAFCEQMGLKPVFDCTNADSAYMRNRIRLELLPLLEDYNPRVRQAIQRMAEILSADQDYLAEMVEQAWTQTLVKVDPGCITLDREKLVGQNRAAQRELLRKAMGSILPSLDDVELETIQRALEFIQAPLKNGQVDLVNGLVLIREENVIYVLESGKELPASGWPQVECGAVYALDFPGILDLSNLHFSVEILPASQAPDFTENSDIKPDAFQAWLNADAIFGEITIRTRQPGDTFQPLGMDGNTQKLSDFFTNEKCPSRARDGWPLVCSNDRIIWIPGYRPAHLCRLTQHTRRVAHFTLQQKEPK